LTIAHPSSTKKGRALKRSISFARRRLFLSSIHTITFFAFGCCVEKEIVVESKKRQQNVCTSSFSDSADAQWWKQFYF
jgi:hypothetical protein